MAASPAASPTRGTGIFLDPDNKRHNTHGVFLVKVKVRSVCDINSNNTDTKTSVTGTTSTTDRAGDAEPTGEDSVSVLLLAFCSRCLTMMINFFLPLLPLPVWLLKEMRKKENSSRRGRLFFFFFFFKGTKSWF